LRVDVVVKRLIVCAAALLFTGCTLSNQNPPALSGPSELALSLSVSAVPDVISQDGASQSMVHVVAKDANGQPVRGLSLRLGMLVGPVGVDYGTLASKSISTDNSGQASTIYTAPVAPPPTVTEDTTVTIQVTPVGNNYENTTPRQVSIHLARTGVILAPNPTLAANFFYSPTQPHETESVQFDGSSSTGAIVSYDWNFGDGTTDKGVRPVHTYAVAGTYNVTLKVTDDRGATSMSSPVTITVVAAAAPQASFTMSPTDPAVNDALYVDASASTVPSGRTIVGYDWNFGDGASGAGQTATHKYGKANSYTIVLTVTDNTGRKGVTSQTITVK
jgi:PKD repeat protein